MIQSGSFIFECPACDQLVDVESEMIGQKAKCPHCRQSIFVPKPCPFCGQTIPAAALKCPHCAEYLDGRLRGGGGGVGFPKSRKLYIVLGLFFGGLGIHNFYAARYIPAVCELGTVVLMWWTGFVLALVCLWAICEVFLVTDDGYGQPMV